MKMKAEIERLKSELDLIDNAELLASIHQLIEVHKAKNNSVSEIDPTYEKRTNILSSALKLSPSERADLVQQLLDSLDQLDMEREWNDLAEKRLSELESGKVKSVSWESIRNAVTNGS